MELRLELLAIGAFLVSALASWIAYPFLLNFAKKRNIVDNPNARKLQREPIPVFGGPAVWLGIVAGVVATLVFVHSNNMPMALGAMTVLMIVGVIDDIYDLSAAVRFIIEIVVVWTIMAVGRRFVNDFHLLWGIEHINVYLSMPLSLVAGVGIINAINMIDGVDGYSSGFGFFSMIIFAFFFFISGIATTGYLAMAVAGALLPFFLHNVFGKKSKMFIGDGGTLMLGTALTVMVFNILYHDSLCSKFAYQGLGLIPFTLAVMAIPVFDTLRVMVMRILSKKSPFEPDKTHLHHLFIDMKFSHIGTTFVILSMNTLIVLIWLASWLLGASIDLQLYIVVFFSLMATFGFYGFMRSQERKGTRFFYRCCALGRRSNIARTGFWKFMMNLVDGTLFVKNK